MDAVWLLAELVGVLAAIAWMTPGCSSLTSSFVWSRPDQWATQHTAAGAPLSDA
jgi:hypothetical protein